ncbi:hypothetical protein [Streptomyces nogalater]|uniref:Uncharacterized protein n=1 Tax=Streptomyces nogalater TaxID=38314 RepID=A0ABW0WS17_STRNO
MLVNLRQALGFSSGPGRLRARHHHRPGSPEEGHPLGAVEPATSRSTASPVTASESGKAQPSRAKTKTATSPTKTKAKPAKPAPEAG